MRDGKKRLKQPFIGQRIKSTSFDTVIINLYIR